MLKPIALLGVTICLSVNSAASVAGMLTTPSIADAGIGDGGTPSGNRNQGQRSIAYVGNPGANFKSLFQFDISGIPGGQTIDSASLEIVISESSGTLGSVDLRRLLVSWVEGNGSDNSNPGTTGVTWNSRDKGGSLANWTAAGASGNGSDRFATTTATLLANGAVGTKLIIPVTADVQLWYDGDAPNFGWLLEPLGGTVSNGIYRGFATNNQSTFAVPTLIVNYSPVPEPSSMLIAFLGVGGAVLMRIRKRGRTVAN